MQRYGAGQYRFWDFIEDGDFDWIEASPEENVYFREVAAAFLRATFEPPAGYVIDVLEAKYVSLFLVIALGWNQEPEPLTLPERREFIHSMAASLNRFVSAVNWEAVSEIKFGTEGDGHPRHRTRRIKVN